MQLAPEQIELRDLIRGFFQDNVTSEYLRARMGRGVRQDTAFLNVIYQLGLAEAFGAEDSTLSFFDFTLVAAESGRFLVPEPLVERLFIGTIAKKVVPESDWRVLATGVARDIGIAPAMCCRSVSVSESGGLSGEITWAYGLDGATHLLVFVERAGGIAACVVDLQRPEVSVRDTSSLDLTCALSAVSLRNAPGEFLSSEGTHALQDCFEVLKACEVSGLCRKVVEMTVEYVRTREQFGVPIGSFQAVQHKLADAYAQSESLEALSRFAGWSVVHSPDQRPLTARAAIAQACDVGPAVCEICLQCHGGIGFTWEYDLHLFLRRAKVIQAGFQLTSQRAEELVQRATLQQVPVQQAAPEQAPAESKTTGAPQVVNPSLESH